MSSRGNFTVGGSTKSLPKSCTALVSVSSMRHGPERLAEDRNFDDWVRAALIDQPEIQRFVRIRDVRRVNVEANCWNGLDFKEPILSG